MNIRMKQKTGLIALLFLTALGAVSLSCGRSVPREQEPNGDFKSAGELKADSAIEGYFDTPDDIDFYTIIIDEPSILDISLSAVRGINHSIKIWDGSTVEPVRYIDDVRKSAAERMCNFRIDGGVLFISVQHGDRDPAVANKENPYRLKVLRRSVGAGNEREPNDSPETAAVIHPNSEVSGFFSPALNRLNKNEKFPGREEDWFSLELRLDGGNPVLLDLDLSPVPDIDSIIHVYGPGMEEILSADSQGTGAGESLKGIGVTASGMYRVRIAARNAAANCDIPYILSVMTREYDLTAEMEPNNDIQTAGIIQTGLINGKLLPRGDRDFFRVKSDGSDRLHKIEVVPAVDLDLFMNIYDTAGKRVYEVNAGGPGEAEILSDVFFREDFHIEIFSRNGSAEGPLQAGNIIAHVCSGIRD